MNKRARDILITVVLIVLAIFVSMRFGRSLPENQPDRDSTIKSMVGDWAVTSADSDAFEVPDVLPSLVFDSDGTWLAGTSCGEMAGTYGFDGTDPIGPGQTGQISFVVDEADIDCGEVAMLSDAITRMNSWEWRGLDMKLSSNADPGFLTISPVL